MKGKKVLHSTGNDEWNTPPFLYEGLNKGYGPFTLDAAATDENHMCPNYYTKEDNALVQHWFGTVWCNPPYSHPLQGQFIKKAIDELRSSLEPVCERVVMLIPARTDTKAFHELIMPNAHLVYFIKGRLHFSYHHDPAGFPSMIVVFDRQFPYESGVLTPTIRTLDPRWFDGYDDYMLLCKTREDNQNEEGHTD